MKKLVLHIGDFKTGSTSIQLAIGKAAKMGAANRDDFHYCMSGGDGFVGHHALVNELKGADYLKGTWLKLAGEIRDSHHHNFIVSSEAFWGIHPDKLKQKLDQVLQGVLIEFVIYLRPHHSRILAAYTQKVKTGQLFGPLEDFVESAVQTKDYNYNDKLNIWKSKFPAANFIVRPFVRSLLENSDVISDFCVHALGLDASYLDPYKRSEMNESPSTCVLQLMDYATRKLNPKMKSSRAESLEQYLLSGLRKKLDECYPKSEATTLKLSQASVNLIRESFEADAKLVDDLYLNGESVFVSSLKNYQGADLSYQSLSSREQNIHEAYLDLVGSLADRNNVYK